MYPEVRGVENKSPEEIKQKLLLLKDRIRGFSEFHREYGRRMLKFGFAAWGLGLLVFLASFLTLRGLNYAVRVPAISISLLIVAGAAPLVITALMLRRQYKLRGQLEGVVKLVEEIHKRRLAEEEGELMHSLLEHNLGGKIATAFSALNQLAGEELPGKRGKMVARSLKAVAESSELLKKAQLLKRIGKAVVTKIYDLDLAITRAIRRVHPEAEEKGVKITYEKTDAFVQGSPMLEELFLNLLENSIRHGNCKRIEITTGVHGDYCIIWVDDDGEGLPRELRKSVFEKGVRSEKSPGRGLGLYLVKRIIEIHGGDIQAGRSSLGGARFRVRLKRVRKVSRRSGS